MQVRLRILRYDPERDQKPHWEQYTVEADPTAPLLDLLHTVKWHQDGSLTFRRSCAHGVCGSDAMLINGRNRLACKIRVDQLGRKISVAPLPGLKVIKDLVVDMDEFFAKYRSVHAVPDRRRGDAGSRAPPVPGGPGALRRHDQVHPVRGLHQLLPQLLGAATATSGRRPSSTPTGSSSTPATRAPTSGWRSCPTPDGVWRCRTIFNCTDACPRGINITRAILEVSSAIMERGV